MARAAERETLDAAAIETAIAWTSRDAAAQTVAAEAEAIRAAGVLRGGSAREAAVANEACSDRPVPPDAASEKRASETVAGAVRRRAEEATGRPVPPGVAREVPVVREEAAAVRAVRAAE